MPASGPGRSWRGIGAEVAARAANRASDTTTGATHARARANTDTVLLMFVLASTPALLISAWSAGHQALAQLTGDTPVGWRVQLLHGAGLLTSADDWLSSFVLGLSYIVPLLFVAGLVSLSWAVLFARIRGRPVDPGWLMTSWLYVLLLPADLSPLLSGLGMSFAAVLGQHVFGGTGRYIASPAALGALFVQFSYPGAGQLSSAASWAAVAASGGGADGAAWTVFAAAEPGALGILLASACLLGAGLLARTGAVSLRTMLGGVLGVALAGTLAGIMSDTPLAQLGWYWHLVLGGLPVCLAFIVTDPTTLPLTRAGRWIHGLMFGVLVVAIRMLDPTHPDGSLFAVLLVTLLVPLIDHFIVRRHTARADGRLELRA